MQRTGAKIAFDLHLCSALGVTRTPNLLIRSNRAKWYWVLLPTTLWSLTSTFAFLPANRYHRMLSLRVTSG